MPRVIYGNFDFEHQLAGAAPPAADSKLGRINSELTPALIGLAEAGDCILCPADCGTEHLETLYEAGLPHVRFVTESDTFPSGATLAPWGWSEAIVAMARQRGLEADAPPIAAVRQANCRQFAHRIETQWNCGLPGADEIHDLAQLESVIGRASEVSPRWVLKARFGMSGRERHLGRGDSLDATTVAWAQKRLARDGVVLWEPWVEIVDEAGLQFDIPRDTPPQLIGVTPLMTDASGGYCGNGITIGDEESRHWEPAVDVGQRLARELQQRGYFGPLGIDAARYRDASGAVALRPLQDINARFTMGRVAWGFRRCLKPGEVARWLQTPLKEGAPTFSERLQTCRQELPSSCRLLPTSPATIGGRAPRIGHVIVTATSTSDLERAAGLLKF